MASMLAMPAMDNYSSNFGERTVVELGSLVADPQSLLRESRNISRTVVPNYQLDLDILSASTYPHPMPAIQTRSTRKRTTGTQLFGGLMMDDVERNSESSHSAHAEERLPPKKKTKRASKGQASDDDEASRKQRGRPRLDTQDETAADRRRTQIRLAQRAYRHRKETTISALKQKVSEMESTIEQMNRSFSQLHDNLFDSGILASKPTLVQQLKSTTEQFAALAKEATTQDSEDEEESKNIAKIRHAASTESFMPDDVESQFQRSQPPSGAAAWGYEFSAAEQEEEGMPRPEFQSDESDQMSMSAVAKSPGQWALENQYQQFNVQIPDVQIDWQKLTAEIERPLQSSGPYTYSFQETTFARRLHRMSLETAYRHLTNPKTDPDYIKRTFKFTFCFSNRKRMLIRFQELLRRRAGESLENWDVPFFRIGGAGTHFPRRDEHGNPIYPPNMVSPARLFGPQVWVSPETPRPDESVEEMLENIGFGGEWFDSHDVEEYLKTKGIFLDGSSSFVDVDPSLISIPALTHSNSSTGSISSRSATKTPEPTSRLLPLSRNDFTADAFNMNSFSGNSSLLEDQLQDKSDVFEELGDFDAGLGIWNTTVSYDLPPSPGYAPTFQELLSRKQRPVTVDVNKFLNRMVQDAGTCLGRAPGFRREQVDNALALSLQEAF